MASGRAVVVSDEVGCCPDLVEDGVTGFVHRARDIASLANALRRATANAAFTTQVGIAAQQRLKSWSYDEDLRGLCAALEHVTGRRIGQPTSGKPARQAGPGQSRQGTR
jgi:glycosyltransferase involved in cell wall biosynthesis